MIGSRIDARRKELRLSQRELARRSGLSAQYVSLLIRGDRGDRIGAEALANLAKALRVSQKFLLDHSADVDKKSANVTGG